MGEEINNILSSISTLVFKSLKIESWSKACLPVEITPGAISAGLLIINQETEEKRIFIENIVELVVALKELDKLTNLTKDYQWNRANFIFFPGGEHEVEYIWDQQLFDQTIYYQAKAMLEKYIKPDIKQASITELLNKDWEIAECTIAITQENNLEIKSRLHNQQGEYELDLRLNLEVTNTILQLHKITNDGVLKDCWPTWDNIYYMLSPDGQINLEFKLKKQTN